VGTYIRNESDCDSEIIFQDMTVTVTVTQDTVPYARRSWFRPSDRREIMSFDNRPNELCMDQISGSKHRTA